MIYILIIIFSSSGKASAGFEFNNLAACQAAASAIQVRLKDGYAPQPSVILCAAKGQS